MPSHIKTYDGSEDPEDHLKIFQAAAKVERWAMSTWCHMFNYTLTGSARVWFDDLPPESVDSYDDLKEAFLANFLQQKKCIKDPVEIHHIKQRERESTEDFVHRFKIESMDVKGSPEGEVAAGNQERKKSLPPWKQQEAGHKQNFKKGGFKNQQSSERRQDRFTILSKSPKEILALEKGKFKALPPMTTPIRDEEHSTSAWMNFVIVRSSSPYSGIIGRPGVRKIQAVPSIAHGMLKFPIAGGILTLKSSKIIPIECAAISGPEGQPSPVNQAIKERIKAAINPEYLEQTIMIRSTLTEEGRNKLCNLLRRNLDVFAWKPADMTGVPRHIVEHQLNVQEGCPPVRQKKRGQADRNQAIQEEVEKLVDVEEGMFLGYKVNTKGIKVCLDKADAILSLLSPKCLKDVQKLNGKLASLNKFLAKSVEKSLPFFKTLKKCTKKSDFHWTEEAEFAFKQMKRLIAKLSMLTAPEEKEELIVYLAAAKEAVSAVLVTEREAKQMPIYFVSRALRGTEVNYTSMEKLVLALVHASKRLKRYFQAHPIIVVTDQPIKQVLSRP
ncbi:reverse transcriptase domain-containing protein [Tanacetum coccineum]